MSRLVWVDVLRDPWSRAKEAVTAALESGADAILAKGEYAERIRELGRIRVVGSGPGADVEAVGIGSEGDGTAPLPANLAESADLARARDIKTGGKPVAAFVSLRGKEYERLAALLGRACDYLVIEGTDWKVIPLENLIAELQGSGVKIIARAESAEEAEVALQTLEKGADGILVRAEPAKVKGIAKAVAARREKIPLLAAEVKAVRAAGMGDRVCVDTCTLMRPGEGMLVGNQSSGLFLIQSEAEESPYVASRPFRVNAGAVHAYVLVDEKTRYLSELASGDPALVVDRDGEARRATVGRVKIERRPLLYVEAEAEGRTVSAILQNAETIKLVGADGASIPVTRLKPGDRVLVRVEGSGRHFGMKIDETIVEK